MPVIPKLIIGHHWIPGTMCCLRTMLQICPERWSATGRRSPKDVANGLRICSRRRVCFSCSTLLRFPIPGGFADAFTASPPSSPASTDFAGAFLRGPASVAEKAKLALFVNSAHTLSIYIHSIYSVYIYTLRIYYLTICAVLLRKHCWNSENSRASEMTRHEQFRDFTKSLFIQSRTHCVMWLSWRSWGVQSEKGSWNWALAASILRRWTWTALNPWDRTLNVFFASQVSGFYSILFILNRIIPECQGSKWKDKEGTKMQTKTQKASY